MIALNVGQCCNKPCIYYAPHKKEIYKEHTEVSTDYALDFDKNNILYTGHPTLFLCKELLNARPPHKSSKSDQFYGIGGTSKNQNINIYNKLFNQTEFNNEININNCCDCTNAVPAPPSIVGMFLGLFSLLFMLKGKI